MDRRHFLKTSALVAGAMYIDFPAFAEKVRTFGDARLRVGILSDIHVTDTESVDIVRHAFEYFRSREADGVIIAGDIADWGREDQLKLVADAWYSVFPKDRLPNGQHVEKLFVYGNHDIEGHAWDWHPPVSDAEAIGPRREKLWKKYFKEDYKPVWLKTVKGYHFVGSHWISQQTAPDVPPFLRDNADQLHYNRPFFFIQHAHPKNTTYGEWAWGQDNGEVTAALNAFPNAIAFSGHSHMPLNDERCLWQDAFTSVGTASLRYLYFLGGRENSKVSGSQERVPSQMKPDMEDCRDGHQGMFMTVYDEYITLERREFLYDEAVDDAWIIPVPKAGESPLSNVQRAKEAKAPEFAEGDRVNVERRMGKDRYDADVKQFVVSFPSVLKKRTGVRANDYEVQVEYKFLDNTFITGTKRVYSPKRYLGENHDEQPVVCPYAESELPDYREFRFVVRPCECFGKKGREICSEWMKK